MRGFWKNGRKKISLAAAALLLVGSMTACGSTSDVAVEQEVQDTLESTVQEGQTGAGNASENMQMEMGYFGEITAIDGTTITVSVMTGGRGGGQMAGGELPEGMEAGQMPDGEKPSGELPEGMESGQTPNGEKLSGELPEGMEVGQMPSGDRPDSMNMEDIPRETMTIEVSDSTTITIDGAEAAVSDLQVGDSIQFTLDGDVAVSISVGMAGGMEGVPGGMKPAETQK